MLVRLTKAAVDTPKQEFVSVTSMADLHEAGKKQRCFVIEKMPADQVNDLVQFIADRAKDTKHVHFVQVKGQKKDFTCPAYDNCYITV